MRYCWHFSTFGVQIFKQAFVLADKYFFVNPQTRIAARYGQGNFKKKKKHFIRKNNSEIDKIVCILLKFLSYKNISAIVFFGLCIETVAYFDFVFFETLC